MTMQAVQVVLIPGRYHPKLAVDLEERADGWYGSLICGDNHGGYEPWRGPYGNPTACERNVAAFGARFLRARGLLNHWRWLQRHYGWRMS